MNINLEYYALSSMCKNDEASKYGIINMKPEYFTGDYAKAFIVIRGLFKLKGTVDYHVLDSQLKGMGLSIQTNLVYFYSDDYKDDWKNVFDELKYRAIIRLAGNDIVTLEEFRRAENAKIEELAGQAYKIANSWLHGTEKKYYSGKEVDEMPEVSDSPILTGHDLLDNGIYKFGGNCKGQMKGVICREKHGKTRSECWEVAQNIRMGHKVLYLALEANKKEITGNVKMILREEWKDYRHNFFIVDGVVDLDELESIVIEGVLMDGIEKVVVDYMQLVEPSEKFSGENEKINIATERFRQMMIRHNFNCVVLNQSKKESRTSTPKDADGRNLAPKGYRFVPDVYDAYGSNALVRACALIMIGFRPNQYEELVRQEILSPKVLNPFGEPTSINSFFMKIGRTRYKPEYLHKWYQFVDTDEGLKIVGLL